MFAGPLEVYAGTRNDKMESVCYSEERTSFKDGTQLKGE